MHCMALLNTHVCKYIYCAARFNTSGNCRLVSQIGEQVDLITGVQVRESKQRGTQVRLITGVQRRACKHIGGQVRFITGVQVQESKQRG